MNTERSAVEHVMKIEKIPIVIDNMHLDRKDGIENKNIIFYRKLAEAYGYELEIVRFPISIEQSILRDKERGEKVGEKMIRRFASSSLLPNKYARFQEFLPYEVEKKHCVIIDLDGTIAFTDGKRSFYDYSKVIGDRFNDRMGLLLSSLPDNWERIFVTGRKNECRKETIKWLEKNGFNNPILFMRKDGDDRKDSIVKKELYEENIKGEYEVVCVFDDRNQVVDMWRNECKLLCLQVYYGDF